MDSHDKTKGAAESLTGVMLEDVTKVFADAVQVDVGYD